MSPSTAWAQELPQHTDPEWVSARAEDRSCSTPPAPAVPPHSPSFPTTLYHAGDRPISVESENPTPRGSMKTLSAISDGSAAASGTIEGRHGKEESVGNDEDAEPRHGNDGEGEGGGEGGGDGGGRRGGEECVTLAITTCKRLRAFLGTAEGLQARSLFFFGVVVEPRLGGLPLNLPSSIPVAGSLHYSANTHCW